MIRHLATFGIATAVTCAATLWWLHDGDLYGAVEPVLPEWDATTLARDAGVAPDAVPPVPVAPDPGDDESP